MRKRHLLLLVAACLVHLAALPRLARGEDPPVAHAPGSPGHDEKQHEPGHEEHVEEHHPELFEEEALQRPLFWVRGEYLLWWTKNGNIPVLVTRGESTDALPGALEQAQTKVLYAGDVSFHERSGARISAGLALGQERLWSLEASYFFLNARRVGTDQTSAGNPVLARPFIDAATNTQDSSIVTFPGMLAGNINVTNSS